MSINYGFVMTKYIFGSAGSRVSSVLPRQPPPRCSRAGPGNESEQLWPVIGSETRHSPAIGQLSSSNPDSNTPTSYPETSVLTVTLQCELSQWSTKLKKWPVIIKSEIPFAPAQASIKIVSSWNWNLILILWCCDDVTSQLSGCFVTKT